MPTKETKLKSVAVDKKKIKSETFEKKGLPAQLSEIKFSIDPNLSSKELLKKLVSTIKRTFKKEYFNCNPKERIDFLNSIQLDDDFRIHAEDSSNMQSVDVIRMQELLHSCLSKDDRLAHKAEEIHVGKITITSEKFEMIGYTALNMDVTANSHKKKWALRGWSEYERVFDVSSLIADVIVIQSLWKYSKENTDMLKHAFLEYTQKLSKHFWAVPSDEKFKKDFMAFAKDNGYSHLAAHDWAELNSFAPYFYGEIPPLDEYDFRNMEYSYFLRIAVREFVRQANYATYDAMEEISSRGDYAKSYQMKKHIKQTHQVRMENNAFLSFYGEVELDNDVDLDKFTVVEENLKELQQVISIPKRKEYSFKIRRLGHHRAAGLFYSYYKTTIFDLNYPDSYVHELGHQIDHILSEGKREDWFSETPEFGPILRLYRTLMEKKVAQLSSNNEFKKQWNGKTKYNKMYYLKPTEVFARSFEVYMTRFDFHNSLLKTEEELRNEEPYLFDEEYVRLVRNLFEGLMKRISEMKSTIEQEPVQVFNSLFDVPLEFDDINILLPVADKDCLLWTS